MQFVLKLSVLPLLLVLSQAQVADPSVSAAQTNKAADATPKSLGDASIIRVDAFTRDRKSGAPLAQLKQTDFVLLDNGHPVEPVSFHAGLGDRPLVLWLTVVCNEKKLGERGSQSFAGKENLLRPALGDLTAHDLVAVAHWCDDGNAGTDFAPSLDRDGAIAALQKALTPIDFTKPEVGHERPGQLAFERMIEFIVKDAEAAPESPVPVIVFLNSDWMFLPLEELIGLADDIEYVSGFAYGMKPQDVPDYPVELAQQRAIYGMMEGQVPQALGYLSWRTGGGYYAVKPQSYAEALRDLISGVHARYEFEFLASPSSEDRHQLEVKFAKGSPHAKSAELRFRPGYPFIHRIAPTTSSAVAAGLEADHPPDYLGARLPQLQEAIPEFRGLQPPTDPESLPLVLARVGEVTRNLAGRLPNLLAHEEVVQKQIRGMGKQPGQERHEFDYLILTHPGSEAVVLDEYRNEARGREGKRGTQLDYPLTQGYVTMWVRFYPANQAQSRFRYLGEQDLNGHNTDVVAFAEKPESTKFPGKIELAGSQFPVFYQGVAWIDKSSFRIVRIRTDLLKPLPAARLLNLTTVVDFAEVHIAGNDSPLWLPKIATVKLDWDRRVFENVHKYSAYRLYKATARIVVH